MTTAELPSVAWAPSASVRPARADRFSLSRKTTAVAVGLALLVAAAGLSLFVGSGDITAAEVRAALTGSGATTTDLLVRDYRVPRTLLSLLAGLALALAGVVMQALTRNPLADPGLLGVSAGSFFFVALGSAFFGTTRVAGQTGWAIAGAGITAAVVYALGTSGPGAGTAAKLVLSGVALGAVLSGVSSAISLARPETFDALRFWSVGSVQGRSWDSVGVIWLPTLVAAGVVLLMSGALNTLSLGDDLATALGAHVGRVRLLGLAVVTVLCGCATAVAGPITFVGLVVPFVVKFVVGVDHRWVTVASAIGGPLLVVCADMVARTIVASELPVGVVVAVLGAPVLVALVRRTTMTAL